MAKTAVIEDTFARAIEDNAPDGPQPLLLMVSGGSDSTALAYLAAAWRDGRAEHAASPPSPDAAASADAPGGAPLVGILHVNHLLRGAAADADEAFVRRLAELLDMPFYLARIDVGARARAEGANEEAVGRRERYAAADEALADLCYRACRGAAANFPDTLPAGGGCAEAAATCDDEHPGNPADFPADLSEDAWGNVIFPEGRILTAHTADDRVENFYMRSIVGTGPGGFRGMARRNGAVLHPLLDCSRTDLRALIEARAAAGAPVARTEDGALWCEDATNAQTDRFRTFVRHEIVPRAKEQNAGLLATLSRSMDLIADEDDYLDEQARAALARHTQWTNPHGPDWFAERMGGILPDTQLVPVTDGIEPEPDFSAGCVLKPGFAEEPLVLRRRAVFRILQLMLGPDARVETASVNAVLNALGASGAVANIQGDLAVSTNKRGTRIEPMEAYRARRKRL